MRRAWRLGLLTAAALVAPGTVAVFAADGSGGSGGDRPAGAMASTAAAGSGAARLVPPGAVPFDGIRRLDGGQSGAAADPGGDPSAAAAAAQPGPPAWNVSLRAINRAGAPAVDGRSNYAVYDLATGAQAAFGQLGPDTVVRLPAGRYAVRGTVSTPASAGVPESGTLALQPELVVAGDTALVLDARRAKRVTVRLEDVKATQVSASVTVLQQAASGRFVRHELGAENFDDRPFFVTPTPPRADTTSYVYTVWRGAQDVYNLVERTAGRVPDRLDFRVRPGELAAVRTTYAAQAAPACGGTYIGPIYRNGPATVAYGTNFALPGRRTEYYSADPEVSWYTQFAQAADCTFAELDGQTGAPRTYRRAGASQELWNAAPLTPAVLDAAGEPLATRDGDTVTVRLPLYSDPQRRRVDFGGPYAGVTGKLALGSGTTALCESATFEPLSCAVPAGARTYRLTAAATRKVPWSALSTSTETTWTFRSGTGSGALPLIGVGYELRLDDDNRAPAGRPFAFTVATDRPVRTARLSASTDNGATWRSVPLAAHGTGWRAVVANPSGGGVALRFAAEDHAGNTVTQQIGDAYLVR
jgi:hypothetical protein